MQPEVVIACGQAKRSTPCPALDLYAGAYFRACRRWALSVTDPNRIYVLSAKYGLVQARIVLDPYEQQLGRPGAVTARQVAHQAFLLNLDHVTFVGGKAYAQLLRDAGVIPSVPFAGPDMRTGKQLGLMTRCLGRFPTPIERARWQRRGAVLA